MDLVGSESRKTGTRGGRADFTWDAVKEEERDYYLGNSVAKPPNRRPGTYADFEWYKRPSFPGSQSTTVQHTPNTSNSASAPAPSETPSVAAAQANDLQIVRRREKAIMERMIVGRSFSEAVRSALTESVGSGVDDDGGHDAAAAAARRAVRKLEKTEKAQRKEMRDRVRELRRVRRAERHTRRDTHLQQQRQSEDSSESERETVRTRLQEDHARRRRRKERDSAATRKRLEPTSTSGTDDLERPRVRRQRLR